MGEGSAALAGYYQANPRPSWFPSAHALWKLSLRLTTTTAATTITNTAAFSTAVDLELEPASVSPGRLFK